ncbi:CpaF family protein [Kitasatospora sp. MBT66]|uniref:CpaF family protein n=1 Tax=Kitasatospora sp. MBT66 TaxID=1444769 RepID=UPI00068ADD41|nr:CpaF/VirB11 family protein [Kitasatospora sp. MBT66]
MVEKTLGPATAPASPAHALAGAFADALEQRPATVRVVPQVVTGPVAVGAVSPAAVPAPAGPAGVLPVPFSEISALHTRVSNDLAEQTASRPGLSEADRRQLGQEIVTRVVSVWATDYAATRRPLTRADEQAVQAAVFSELFEAGRLQALLDDPGIENILLRGHKVVRVDYHNRPSQLVAPVADSNEGIIALVNKLARQAGHSERALTPSSPMLNLAMPDGSRLAATAYISAEPEVVIRRHRVQRVSLEDLISWGTIDSTLAAFLRALVRSRKNILVVGSQGVGKTSLLRALAREIPRHERVGTLETDYELWLHKDDDGPEVVAFEARESNGERGPDGKPAGAITLLDMFPQALRMSLRRVIVGEVRSAEVLPMLHAMNEGEGGSMATLHARTARKAIERLVTLCLEAGTGMTPDLAYRLTEGVDFIVYVRLVDETEIGGRRHRFVSDVLEINGLGEGGRPATSAIFGPREAGGRREPRAVPLLPPQCLDDLVRAGFDRSLLRQEWGAWAEPMRTVTQL